MQNVFFPLRFAKLRFLKPPLRDFYFFCDRHHSRETFLFFECNRRILRLFSCDRRTRDHGNKTRVFFRYKMNFLQKNSSFFLGIRRPFICGFSFLVFIYFSHTLRIRARVMGTWKRLKGADSGYFFKKSAIRKVQDSCKTRAKNTFRI